ncbi:unnamed protein product [Brassica rapa subsp. trilocularis]
MSTFRINPNLELEEFTQPLLKKKKSSPSLRHIYHHF